MRRKTVATNPTPFEERLSFMVHRLHAKLAQVAGRLLRAHDLDPVSSRILVLLLGQTDMRVGDLVEMLVLPQSTVSHQLQRLERAGLIERNRPAEDSRSVLVTLTARGLTVSAECDDLSRRVHKQMVEGLSPDEIETLHALLSRVFGSLDAMGPSPQDGNGRPRQRL